MTMTFESSVKKIVSTRTRVQKAERLAGEAIAEINKIAEVRKRKGGVNWIEVLSDKQKQLDTIQEIKDALALEIKKIEAGEFPDSRKGDYCPSCGAEL